MLLSCRASWSSGMTFGISEKVPEIMPDDLQALFLGLSGIIYGIAGHNLWNFQA